MTNNLISKICDRINMLRIAVLTLALLLLMASCSGGAGSSSVDKENVGYGENGLTEAELRDAIDSGRITNASEIKYSFPTKKPGNESDGMELDQDTLMWLNATYAVQMEANSMDLYYVAGIHEDQQNEVEGVDEMLRSSWGVKNRKTLIETTEWLLDGGHREKYAEYVEAAKEQGIIKLGDKPLTEYQKAVTEKNPDLEEKDVRRMAYAAYMYANEGIESILFWDYSRAISILGWGYIAGYITIDEYLYQSVPIGLLIQKEYGSWEEAGKNYLIGYKYWRDQEPDSKDVEYIMRETAYDMMCENTSSIYSLDFNYNLKMEAGD